MEKPHPKILLIEDDKPMIDILSKTLTEEGFLLTVAGNGEEGYKKALELRPDLLLVDILMPKMNGMDMIKKVRLDAWGKTVKIIIITNLSDPLFELEAKKLAVLDYVIKSDWDLNEIVTKIKKIL